MTATYTPRSEWLILQWHRATVAAGVLCIQRCDNCQLWRHPPRRYCPACQAAASSFEPVAGNGTIISFAVSHRSLDPGWQERVPFVTLVVELDEGPRVLAATDLDPAHASIGTRVALRSEARGEDFALLWADPTPDR
jgi:uncharacterized OB-fold protein